MHEVGHSYYWLARNKSHSMDSWTPYDKQSMVFAIFQKKILRKHHIVALDLDQCQYGTSWRKSTRLICSRIDPCSFSRLTRRCVKDRQGRCSRTHKYHIQLRGTHPSGVPWTSIASAYPKSMARNIAFCLMEKHVMTYPESQYCRNRPWVFVCAHFPGIGDPLLVFVVLP